MPTNKQASIVNVSGDYEETILQLAKHLGRSKNRRAVFALIYGRGSRPRSRKQIGDELGLTGNTQVVQDALDDLAKHHLVVRVDNEGSVKDGSRYLYGKAEVVRANRDKIVKFADNPDAAKRVATKRRPAVEIAPSFVRPSTTRKPASNPGIRRTRGRARLKIAILVTNPDRSAQLQTAIEARDIDEAIRLGGGGKEVEIKILPAPTLRTLLDMLNSFRPDVIHFSGHGGGRSLVFDNERVADDGGTVLDFDMVASVVSATSAKPKLLVLAACDTTDGADRLLDCVPVVIAMADSIDDEAAVAFSGQFYRSLSSGASISNSLTQAKLFLKSEQYPDASLPTLLTNNKAVADGPLL